MFHGCKVRIGVETGGVTQEAVVHQPIPLGLKSNAPLNDVPAPVVIMVPILEQLSRALNCVFQFRAHFHL